MFVWRRFSALVSKEFKDFGKNKNVLIMVLMPILFGILYKQMFIRGDNPPFADRWMVLSMCLGMSLVMTAGFMCAMTIAEEKEKQTLRTLLLAGMTPLEFFLGKSVVSFLFAMLVNAVLYVLVGFSLAYLPVYLLISGGCAMILCVLGAAIGVIAKNQMSTGVVGLPLMLVFLLLPLFAMLDRALVPFARFVPIYSMNVMLRNLLQGQLPAMLGGHLFDIAMLVGWMALGLVLFGIAYRKVGIDGRNAR